MYRPPIVGNIQYEEFAREWSLYLERFIEVQEELLIVGDFNIHVDTVNSLSDSFTNILDANGLKQHADQPTHRKGHTLDLVITRDTSGLLRSPPVISISGVGDLTGASSCDHYAVWCYLNIARPKTISKTVTYRSLRKIPIHDYRADILRVVECNSETAGALVEQYNGKLQALTDKYAPPQNKTITLRPHAPWYTEALRREKRERRKCERTATRTLLTVDREIAEERYARRTVQIEQAAYYTSQIDKNKGDSKTLFKLTNSLMGKNGETILPTHLCDKTLADQFLSFFHNKIDNIRMGLCAMVDEPLVEIPDQSFNGVPLNCFSGVTLQEIRHIILSLGVCISDSFKVTNGVRQGGILSPQLFNIYIDGLSDILNKSSVGGSIGGKRINHMLYADDLCIVSLSSAGLQQLLTICDQYCAMHSITFNVKKSVCMFFRCSMNKTCDITNVVLSGNTIDYVHKTKYLGVLLCSDMKTSIDVCRQTSRFYAQANTLLRNFRYCSDDVKCMLFRSFCTNMYCSPLWFNSTSSSIKKLKTSYNGALRRLLLIKKPYSASTMFVTHGIPSFFELLRKCIYNFSQRISLSSNSIIVACLAPSVFIHSPVRQWWRSVLY